MHEINGKWAGYFYELKSWLQFFHIYALGGNKLIKYISYLDNT